MSDSEKVTVKAARALLGPLDITMRSTAAGEYRVNLRGGGEETAYYTDDLGDAVGTGRFMAMERDRATVLRLAQRAPGSEAPAARAALRRAQEQGLDELPTADLRTLVELAEKAPEAAQPDSRAAVERIEAGVKAVEDLERESDALLREWDGLEEHGPQPLDGNINRLRNAHARAQASTLGVHRRPAVQAAGAVVQAWDQYEERPQGDFEQAVESLRASTGQAREQTVERLPVAGNDRARGQARQGPRPNPIRLNPHYDSLTQARIREEVRGLPDEELQARAAATHEAYGEARRLGDRQWMETYGGGLQLARTELQQRGIEDPTRQRDRARGAALGD